VTLLLGCLSECEDIVPHDVLKDTSDYVRFTSSSDFLFFDFQRKHSQIKEK
jgi:hypothetical protein